MVARTSGLACLRMLNSVSLAAVWALVGTASSLSMRAIGHSRGTSLAAIAALRSADSFGPSNASRTSGSRPITSRLAAAWAARSGSRPVFIIAARSLPSPFWVPFHLSIEAWSVFSQPLATGTAAARTRTASVERRDGRMVRESTSARRMRQTTRAGTW